MVMTNNRPLKRARRNRITADLHDFLFFPAGEGADLKSSSAAAAGGPFRDAVKAFLTNHARLTFPPSLFPSLLTWQIVFRVGDLVDGPDLSPLVVALDIVEEDVTRSPRSVYCNQCRVVVETLSGVALDQLSFHGRGPRSRLQAAIAFYKSLSTSELVTLKDLFTFLLRLIRETTGMSGSKLNVAENDSGSSRVLCAWTRSDVEEVQQSMIKVLAAASSETKWVARHTLKGVMCQKASPELLNYSLAHLEGMLAPKDMVVRARCSPASYDVEFRLEPASTSRQGLHPCYPWKEQIKSDLKFLFDSLINPETMEKFRPSVTRQAVIDSATKLIDCKQFIKDFKPEKQLVNYSSSIYLMCHVELFDQSREEPAIPPELLVLPSSATVASLKSEAGKAFQEVYAMCKRLQIDGLLEYGSVEDSFTLKFLIGSTGTVRMKGTCSSKSAVNRYRMERGTEKWTVDCTCGAKDDDGERMLACDSCGVWQHTRCAGIENCDPTPDKFLCIRCKSFLYEKRSDSDAGTEQSSERSSPDKMSTCRGKEAVF